METYKDLIVYKKAFALAMEIFEITKEFPEEEKYSLIDQMRRSSKMTTKAGNILSFLPQKHGNRFCEIPYLRG